MLRPPRISGRTPLFSLLRRTFKMLRISKETGVPVAEVSQKWREYQISRRTFLSASAQGVAAIGAAQLLSACSRSSSIPLKECGGCRIAIVGAGIAGLHAAWILRKAGYKAQIFEASNRAGGRMFTAENLLGDGLTTELGGEFIDSSHADMLSLVKEFDLELIDTHDLNESSLEATAYYFNGTRYSEAQVIQAFAPIADKISADFESTGEIVDFQNEGDATALDEMSIEQYLTKIGAQGLIRSLLSVAYLTEYGLEISEQSALNLVFLIDTDVQGGEFRIFGDSDERFKIRGGNQSLPRAMADELHEQIEFGHKLVAVKNLGTSCDLSFEIEAGASKTVTADFVLLTVPFSILRTVTFTNPLPAQKQKAINELGYGTNAKVLVGFKNAIWRKQNTSGNAFTDELFQSCWDNSRLQGKEAAGLTLYTGGKAGIAVGLGSAQNQLDILMPGVEKVFPGASQALNGKVERIHWPTFPLARGSYSAYKPGQWTTIAGSEILPVERIYFAGEHCSYDFQGYMNGAAETGRRAAEAIIESLGA